jgi:LPXTG-site transpeptidase (sortase) family protein
LIAALQITNPAAPVKLLVPAIGVSAAVEAVGRDAQGNMGTPTMAANVAWYQPGVAPGDSGNAVIAGHLDWTTGPAVFWYLGKLKKGDQVTVIRADGSQALFQIESTGTMPFDSSTDGMFTRGGAPTLALITCAGAWDRARATYSQRLVVQAVLTSIRPASG